MLPHFFTEFGTQMDLDSGASTLRSECEFRGREHDDALPARHAHHSLVRGTYRHAALHDEEHRYSPPPPLGGCERNSVHHAKCGREKIPGCAAHLVLRADARRPSENRDARATPQPGAPSDEPHGHPHPIDRPCPATARPPLRASANPPNALREASRSAPPSDLTAEAGKSPQKHVLESRDSQLPLLGT